MSNATTIGSFFALTSLNTVVERQSNFCDDNRVRCAIAQNNIDNGRTDLVFAETFVEMELNAAVSVL